ncbi:ETX/MTX2 family pore-forming toxin [Bacillus thuringiensis]|nr:ETX/MTX2 family pore-forming toxin [Bacillus thuringiensis]
MASIFIILGVFPSTIQAENRNNQESFQRGQTQSVFPDYEDVKGLQNYITDKNTLYTTLRAYTNQNVQKVTGVNFIYYKLPEYSIETDGIQQDTLSSPVYIGVSYVSHTGGTREQTLYSSLFSKAVTESITTTTTHGAKAGAKFKIPIVGETNIELNAEYNFSYAGMNTSTETITYTVPAQPVKLQPNQTAKITAILKMVQMILRQ